MNVSRIAAIAIFTTACGGAVTAQRPAPAPSKPAESTKQADPAAPVEAAKKAGEAKTSTDPKVNPDAAVMADFEARVEKYVDLHKQLAKGAAAQKETPDPAKISAAKAALAAKIQAARPHAKQGDIFTPEIRNTFRRLLAPELRGEDGRDAKAVIKDDAPAPGTIPFKVNAKYPESQPLPSVPANVLLNLPTLPEPLEYRIVGKHMILLDTASDLIVDYIPNAIR
jgi:hypothetical protein